ncbi:MAG: bifunctional phosphopantothenoylcysteine decarboxylase/phosphopantothenate--cysteine ligase CoaBC [Pseudomonadales bacterium]|jgi:phosphopantothenoylcysteine decarboxylase/phosphopantothenate--cysteine ligase|nr:bifunctional phosphopantothenoylcysteine decarboxylase/phosphopantothenate--cysteine ligase CoaBC [Pseudomonadales bacterium]
MSSLRNKRLILGLSGGIAAYKAAELCRLFIKAGAEVKVVMTEGAQAFITPMTLQALSGQRVHTSLLDAEAEAAMGHIELARWADLIVVAPASASFIARLAKGDASDLLSALCLARRGPLAIAPAMNQAMWGNAATAANLDTLRQRGIALWGPDSGAQACGDVGLGRLLEPAALLALAEGCFESGVLAGLTLTLTAGPTREALDPVRYLSNHSSGKMGYALAEAAVQAGASVTLISGPTALAVPERLRFVPVESAAEMLRACQEYPADIFIGVAAVADYRPAENVPYKIKKEQEMLSLNLLRNPDILATIAASSPKPFCVGFAAETHDLAQYARAKLRSKNLDLIFANDAAATFGSDEAEVLAFWNDGELRLERASKTQLARGMIRLIGELLARRA